jgi:hypothetical protein
MVGIVRDRRRLIAWTLIVLGVVGLLVSGSMLVGAQSTEEPAEGNESDVPQTGPYDRAELERGGAQVANAPSSVRWYGETGQLWLRHVSSNMFSRFLDDEDLLQYVSTGEVISRDYVYLEGVRGRSAPAEDLTLTVVYWEPSTTDGGDEIASNQRVDEVDVTLPGGGYDRVRVDLRNNYDEPVHVTMWVNGHQGELQWTFRQRSSAATESFAADSRGDFAFYGAIYYLLIVFGTAGGLAIVSYKPLKKAAAPPGYSPFLYIGPLLFAIFMVALIAWDWFIEIIATAPWLLSVVIGIAIYIIFVETLLDESRKALFFQLHIDEAEDNEDGSGTIPFSTRIVRLVDTQDGTGVIKKGIRPFLSRMFGRTPLLDLDGSPRTSLESTSGPFSECYLIHPYADEVLDYQPEEWMLDVVEERDLEDVDEPGFIERMLPDVDWFRVVGSMLLVAIGWMVGAELVASGLVGATVGAIAGLFWCSTPVTGRARTELAPMGFDEVLANVIQMKEGLEEKADRDFYREKWHTELGSNHAKRKSEAEEAESGVYQGVIQRRTEAGSDDDRRRQEASADDD